MGVRPEAYAGVTEVDLSGKTVLVTGSTDGIGREAAVALGRLGARVLVHGRSREKADRVVREVESAGGEGASYIADFASFEAVHDFAREVRRDHNEIDVLANNAGTYFREPRTIEGVEATLAVNHLAPFLLTHRLLPAVPEDGRIVTTASAAHREADLDPDALDDLSDNQGFEAYSRSKLANVLFTRELARRLDDRTATCFHPGFVPGSALWRDSPIYVRGTIKLLGALPDAVTRRFADTPATGAANLVYLAAAEDARDLHGEYVSDMEASTPSGTARDDDLARRLWERSEELVGIDGDDRITTD